MIVTGGIVSIRWWVFSFQCKQLWIQYRQLSSFLPFDAFRRLFFVALSPVTSLESSTVGNCTVTGEQPLVHASLDTWHISLSMPGRA